MSFKSEINQIRRTATKAVTRVFVARPSSRLKKGSVKPEIKRVLINRPNHRLGNMLLVTPLVQEIISNYPDVKIDLFVRGFIAPVIFENYPQVEKTISLPRKPFKELLKYMKVWVELRKNRYDLVIDVVKGSSSGRISTVIAKSRYKYFGDDFSGLDQKYPDYVHMAKFPVYNFREFLSLAGGETDQREVPVLDLKLSSSELENGKKLLDELTGDPSRKTIAFFTYATGDKCFSTEWWDDFYELFHSKYKDEYNLIEILPVENISQLQNKLPSFYSKDIREIGSLMANCRLVVAGDSGMMHLSSASLVPTVGLFSVSSLPMYRPYGNLNCAVDANNSTHQDIIGLMDKVLS